MNLRWPGLISPLLAAASILVFMAGGDYLARTLIEFQQTRQLEELANVALRRSEDGVDFGATTLNEIIRRGPVSCSAADVQALRLNVYERGAIKDLRMVDSAGGVRCSAFSETLEFDRSWPKHGEMLGTRVKGVRLFRVEHFIGTALGILHEIEGGGGLVAILGMSDELFDVVPKELGPHSAVRLELTNDETIARSSDWRATADKPVLTYRARSTRYPIRVVLQVDRQALSGWHQEPYQPILVISTFLGMVFALLLIRSFVRPPAPENELDNGLAKREFRPYLQPYFDLATGTITGAEVLARWVKADGSVIPPARFIDLAERSGRIAPITWQLLSAALAHLKPFLNAHPDFRLSVNITPTQFVAPDFVDDLRQVVAEADVAYSHLTLEVTEREAIEDAAAAATVVARLQAMGFKVAIDDVGIGHSGLSQIQQLKADTIKIDKFFVDCIDRDAFAVVVVEMLVRMAAQMSMSVIAEGIETEAQARALLGCGVVLGQGYLVSPPVPLDQFLALAAGKAADAAVTPRKQAA